MIRLGVVWVLLMMQVSLSCKTLPLRHQVPQHVVVRSIVNMASPPGTASPVVRGDFTARTGSEEEHVCLNAL